MSKRTTGWKLIGRKGGEYYFVDSVFEHQDNFRGVTGSIVRPVSPKEYEEASDRENVAERLEDYWNVCHARDDYDNEEDFDAAFEDFIDEAIEYDGIDQIMFDGSDNCNASDSFDELGIKHEFTDCSGCGRIFGKRDNLDFDEVFDYPALVAIRAYEGGSLSRDYVARIIFGE